MEFTDDLTYSSDAQITNYFFYKDLNNINVFVEDAGKEYEYETIFKRLFGKKYKITKILGVGGKENLKASFHEFGTFNNDIPEIKNVFLADGDFDRYICPEDMINNSHFIYLQSYNIENYFIDKVTSEKFTKGKLQCSDKEIVEKIDFETWKTTIIQQAKKLFLVYCFIKKYHPTEASVSRSPYLFLDNFTGLERAGCYESYWETILTLDAKAPDRIAEIETIYDNIYSDNGYNLICGKFLFESLYCHIRRITGKKFRKEDLRWDLVCNFNVTSLSYLKEKVLSIMAA